MQENKKVTITNARKINMMRCMAVAMRDCGTLISLTIRDMKLVPTLVAMLMDLLIKVSKFVFLLSTRIWITIARFVPVISPIRSMPDWTIPSRIILMEKLV